ncbi:MAG: ribosome maturation factor RimP, partial [Lachnospiraceae bacterium]|nr:ribosome maturation factor RimP [Lachnospiraceae bacterium]
MSKKETIETTATTMLEPLCKENGVEIYDVEYVQEAGEWYLRAY